MGPGCVLGGMATDRTDPRFSEFIAARSGALLSFAHRLTNSPEDAEDLLQDVLLRCALRWRHIEADDPEGYVRRALARQAANRWRRTRQEVPLDTQPDLPSATAFDPDERRELWQALQALPPRQRTVLVLRFYEGLSEAQIADTLGIRPGTVKSQAARGLQRLRQDWIATKEMQ
jgi:RNA polymerase sigma-70 factor (sigma-E family)